MPDQHVQRNGKFDGPVPRALWSSRRLSLKILQLPRTHSLSHLRSEMGKQFHATCNYAFFHLAASAALHLKATTFMSSTNCRAAALDNILFSREAFCRRLGKKLINTIVEVFDLLSLIFLSALQLASESKWIFYAFDNQSEWKMHEHSHWKAINIHTDDVVVAMKLITDMELWVICLIPLLFVDRFSLFLLNIVVWHMVLFFHCQMPIECFHYVILRPVSIILCAPSSPSSLTVSVRIDGALISIFCFEARASIRFDNCKSHWAQLQLLTSRKRIASVRSRRNYGFLNDFQVLMLENVRCWVHIKIANKSNHKTFPPKWLFHFICLLLRFRIQ